MDINTKTIYPTTMQTHANEELWVDAGSGKTFKELCPSAYKDGWAFIGIWCDDDGKSFIDEKQAEEYLCKTYGVANLQHSYAKGYHYYSEWEREATVLRYE